MRWQPWARAVVAVAGLGCAVTIYMLYGARKAPSRIEPPPVVDATTTSQSGPGEFRRVKDGRDTMQIKFAGRTVRSDGSVRFDQAHMKSLDDRALEVWADAIESKGKAAQADNPAELYLTGHVKLKTKDGLEALMDSATYDDGWGALSTPGHITFTRARMSGEGDGAHYNEKEDVLSLLDHAHVVIAGEQKGTRAFEANSHQMTLLRPARLVRLAGEARIVRDKDALSSDNAVLHMTDDESKLTRIELSGQARVEPGATSDAASPPDMRADEIDLILHDDGQTIRQAGLTSKSDVAVVDMTSDAGHRIIKGSKIGFDLARDGQTLTRLDADQHVKVTLPKTADNGPREILSDTLRATGAEQKGLTGALFEGRSVTYSEELLGRTGPGVRTRTVVSRSLKLTLDGQLDAVNRALFNGVTGDVELKDPDGNASAAIADYDPAAKLMLLRPATSGAAGQAVAGNADRTVRAREINLHIDSSDLDASGNVTTKSTPSSTSGEGRTASPLFSTDGPITGFGETLKLVGDDATYTGTPAVPARLKQDLRRVVGRVITYNSKTSSLHANGAVEALMIADTANSKDHSGPSEYTVEKADSLVYDDTARTALFKGPSVKVLSKDGTTTARSFEVKFAPDSGAVQQLMWDGDVRADLPDKRRGAGDHLRYDADVDQYDLKGNPAQVLYAKTDGSGCALSSGGELRLDRTKGTIQGNLFETSNLPCDTPLPYKKAKDKDKAPN